MTRAEYDEVKRKFADWAKTQVYICKCGNHINLEKMMEHIWARWEEFARDIEELEHLL